MANRFNDPLLLAGKGIAIFLQAMMVIGIVALIIVMGGLALFHGDLIAEFQAETGNPDLVFPLASLFGVMLIGLAIVVSLFLFFRKLHQIIRTVGEGDPFVADNANRLSAMAWLMLATQLLLIPAVALGMRLAQFADEVGEAGVNEGWGGLDLSGLLMVVILFILARVFRKGTEMRADLEGTV